MVEVSITTVEVSIVVVLGISIGISFSISLPHTVITMHRITIESLVEVAIHLWLEHHHVLGISLRLSLGLRFGLGLSFRFSLSIPLPHSVIAKPRVSIKSLVEVALSTVIVA